MSRFKLSFGLLLCLSLWACEDFFDQEIILPPPKFDKLLAIHSFFSNLDDTLLIPVSRNFDLFSNHPDSLFAVLDAKVEWIEEGQAPQVLSLNPAFTPDTYFLELPQALKPKTAYTIRVSHPDFPTLSARQIMPSVVPLDSAVHDPNGPINAEGNRQEEVRFTFTDPANEVNFYEFSLVTTYLDRDNPKFDPVSKKFLYDTIWRKGFVYLSGSNEPTAKPGPGSMLVSDQAFNGRRVTIGIHFNEWQRPNDLEAVFRNITQENYLYKVSRRKFDEAAGDPFVDPVILYSNVQNGIGVFGLQSVQRRVVK